MATKYVVVKTRSSGSRGMGSIGMLVDADDHARVLYETKAYFTAWDKRDAARDASEAAERLGFTILEGDAR